MTADSPWCDDTAAACPAEVRYNDPIYGAMAACHARADILAVTKIGESEGLAEVVVSDGGRAETVTGDWVATKPSLAPDGRRLVVVQADGDYESSGPDSTTLRVLGPGGADARRLTDGPFDDEPDWSPDGERIAYSARASSGDWARRILSIPVGGGEPEPLLPDGPSDDHAPAWSPDGESIAWIRSERDASGPSSVWVANAGGDGARPLRAMVLGGHSLDWHPDGRTLLVNTYAGGGGVFLLDAASGDIELVAVDGLFGTWSADGASVYYLTPEDGPGSPWRLGQGRIVDGRLEVERFVDEIEEFYSPSPYLGLAVSRCTAAGY
jgi:Tol biopolymer transport system component